jgi:hypothetical protein
VQNIIVQIILHLHSCLVASVISLWRGGGRRRGKEEDEDNNLIFRLWKIFFIFEVTSESNVPIGISFSGSFTSKVIIIKDL